MKFLIYILFLSIGWTQNSEKIILNEEIQDYLFSTQNILKEYIEVENKFFRFSDSNENVDYKSISDSLVSLYTRLEDNRNHFYEVFNQEVNEKENNLIMFLDDYISKLSDTIIQVGMISTKLNNVFDYPPGEYSQEITKFEKLKSSYMEDGQILNFYLNDFLLTKSSVKD